MCDQMPLDAALGVSIRGVLQCDNPSRERVAVSREAAGGARARDDRGAKVVVRDNHRLIAAVVLHACDRIADSTARPFGIVSLHLDSNGVVTPRGHKVNPKVTTRWSRAYAIALHSK